MESSKGRSSICWPIFVKSCPRWAKTLSPQTLFHLEKMNSRRELKNLERQLADEGKKNMMIGGADLEDCVKNMMKRVLTNRMMAMMNMDGTGPKKALGKTWLFRVIIDGLAVSHFKTLDEMDVEL
ncbi:uncharacterized protein LOC144520128 [Sander vitreus]